MIVTAIDSLKESNRQLDELFNDSSGDFLKDMKKGMKKATTPLACSLYSNAIGLYMLGEALKEEGKI